MKLIPFISKERKRNHDFESLTIHTSPKRLHKNYFSSGHTSGGSYFTKAVKFLSAKFRLRKKDDGLLSAAAISEASKMDTSPEVVEEFYADSESSMEVTESSHDLILSMYLQELARRKDLLHLIHFYPVKKEAEVDFDSLIKKFSSLKRNIRKSQDPSRYGGDYLENVHTLFHDSGGDYLENVQTLFHDIGDHLDAAAFDMKVFFPQESDSEYLTTVPDFWQMGNFWSAMPEVNASVLASATHRALKCIKDLKVNKLGISGSDAVKVAETLKFELTSEFDMVLYVRVESQSIRELMKRIEEEIQWRMNRSTETSNKIIAKDQLLNCLLFVDCTDVFIDLDDREFVFSKWFDTLQIVMINGIQNDAYCPVDLDIRIQDHLLPWILFSAYSDRHTWDTYPSIQKIATSLIEECHGHLLAIILLAKALSVVDDVSVWELALQELTSQQEPSSSQLARVLNFIWPRMKAKSQSCIIKFASRYTGSEFEVSLLIFRWIIDGLVKSKQEGEHVLKDLIDSLLVERVSEKRVRMRDEIRVMLVANFAPRRHGLYLMQDGSETNKRKAKDEEWDARENLIKIPIIFFDGNPSLQTLDLSSTSIKCLPASISKLKTLRKLFIRNCDLMMQLPPEIGGLENLKVFDSEGTQLICLPKEFGLLTKLECLKFSLYNLADTYNHMRKIPVAELSNLVKLKELSICVDSYAKWWEDEVNLIIYLLYWLRNLESLKLYIPTTIQLHVFMETRNWEGVPIYQHLSNFGFVVGHLQQRLVSCLPLDLVETFVKLPKCLTYTNVEGDAKVMARGLKHANALFLDRHWTIKSLYTFKDVRMEKLKFCLLAECNKMLHIVNSSYFYEEADDEIVDSSMGPVLGSLQYLSIHHMKSLRSIWNGPILTGSLSNLKSLAMHGCPELRTILTPHLLENLTRLEYLIVEDCASIKSVISLGSNQYSSSTHFLPRLKQISLVDLPKLVSISHGISIAPILETLVIYNCPELKKLSYEEVSDHINEIKGENEWWNALKWDEQEGTSGFPNYLIKAFIPIGKQGGIMNELADALNTTGKLPVTSPSTPQRKKTHLPVVDL